MLTQQVRRLALSSFLSTKLGPTYIIITNICCLLIIGQFSKHYMKDRQEDRESSQQPFTVDSTMSPISQMK